MCTSLAGRVLDVSPDGRGATVDLDGTPRPVSLTMLVLEGTPVEPGDWVLVHTGFAMRIISAQVAATMQEWHRELTRAAHDTGARP